MNIDRRIKQNFYGSLDWFKLSKYKLNINPYCECEICKEYGIELMADQVHHIIDIDDRFDLRLTFTNLMSVNHSCHSRITMEHSKEKNKIVKEKNKYDSTTNRLIEVVSVRGDGQ
jgi:hypothetical protein